MDPKKIPDVRLNFLGRGRKRDLNFAGRCGSLRLSRGERRDIGVQQAFLGVRDRLTVALCGNGISLSVALGDYAQFLREHRAPSRKALHAAFEASVQLLKGAPVDGRLVPPGERVRKAEVLQERMGVVIPFFLRQHQVLGYTIDRGLLRSAMIFAAVNPALGARLTEPLESLEHTPGFCKYDQERQAVLRRKIDGERALVDLIRAGEEAKAGRMNEVLESLRVVAALVAQVYNFRPPELSAEQSLGSSVAAFNPLDYSVGVNPLFVEKMRQSWGRWVMVGMHETRHAFQFCAAKAAGEHHLLGGGRRVQQLADAEIFLLAQLCYARPLQSSGTIADPLPVFSDLRSLEEFSRHNFGNYVRGRLEQDARRFAQGVLRGMNIEGLEEHDRE